MSQFRNILMTANNGADVEILPSVYFNGNCVVNTGIIPSRKLKVEISHLYKGGDGYFGYGCRTSSTSADRCSFQCHSSGFTTIFGVTSIGLSISGATGIMTYQIASSKQTLTIGTDTVSGNKSYTIQDAIYSFYIGGVNNAGVVSTTKLKAVVYYVDIDDGTQHHFVGAKDSSGKILMYDTINHQKYYPIIGTLLEN